MRARSTRIGTERQKARNRAYNLRNGLKEPGAPPVKGRETPADHHD
jgi:hypothetical protein